MERYHTVAALGPGDKVERVVCGYCQSARKYKDPATAPKKAPGAPRASRKREAEADPEPTGPAKPYAPAEHFAKGEALLHSRYGRGRVTEVRGDRIDVKFADGAVRTFLHRAGR